MREATNLRDPILQSYLTVFIDVDRDDPSDVTAAWSVVYDRPPASPSVQGRPKPSEYMPQPGPSPIKTAPSDETLPKRQHDSGVIPQQNHANKSNVSPDLAATTDNRNDQNDGRPDSPPGDSDGQSASIRSEQSDLEKSDDSFSDHATKGQRGPFRLNASHQ